MIRISNLSTAYGDRQILKDISLTLEAGKITVIVGPNGCGKSTLLKTLVKLNPISRGEIRIGENPIESLTAPGLARLVAYLPQNKRPPDISALKMVLHGRFAWLNYPRKYRKEDIQIAESALAWAGMEESGKEVVSRLSGGMQQKVYLAMALAQDTEMILLDEPTTYLDIGYQLRLMEMVVKLAEEGKGVVMVLHDLPQALKIAHKVVVMKEGRIAGQGSPGEVLESGILPEVFGVEIEKVQGKRGEYYLCEALPQRKEVEG
ncbi:MAG: ABC transporter ATP-binding protein [Lachnospiraceae bacterium]|nr:ABC transporter ATP-binding protein [Lachnospiraceae bacterium]